MKTYKVLLGLFAATLLSAPVLPTAHADTYNKKTIITFSQDVEIPGKILPAGTYTFKLLDSAADRHIVQIYDADGSHLITTVLAINDYRLKPTGETVIKFSERPADSPEALRAWFYPGDNFGQEFVYPRERALQLAQTNKSDVPSVGAATLDDSTMQTTPIAAVTPEQKEVEVTSAFQTTASTEPVATPASTEPVATPAPTAAPVTPAPAVAATPAPMQTAQVTETNELPQTASSTPLMALLGGLAISLGLALKLMPKAASYKSAS
jgi:thiol:disulfide interchange protein